VILAARREGFLLVAAGLLETSAGVAVVDVLSL
jgi:hypothetical protein